MILENPESRELVYVCHCPWWSWCIRTGLCVSHLLGYIACCHLVLRRLHPALGLGLAVRVAWRRRGFHARNHVVSQPAADRSNARSASMNIASVAVVMMGMWLEPYDWQYEDVFGRACVLSVFSVVVMFIVSGTTATGSDCWCLVLFLGLGHCCVVPPSEPVPPSPLFF